MPDILINYGTDLPAMTKELMLRAGVAARLNPSMRVCIKPNLVVARPADGGATTHPEIVEGIIQFLLDCGVRSITVAEGAWVGDSTVRAFKTCGWERLAKEYGVRLVDTKSDRVIRREAHGMELGLCETPATADYLINVPVLKAHCQTVMTCCLKNLKGCIPDSEKRRYHTMGLHRPIAALNTVLKPHLHIVDSVCGDLSFEEGGNPVEANRVLLGFDGLLLDSYCAGLLGLDVSEVDYLGLAERWGVGKMAGESVDVLELNGHNKPKTVPQRSGAAKRLAQHIEEDGACSACYAALIHALDKSPRTPREKIKIGQGFRGKSCDGFGVGNCTAGCSRHVAGCPPKAVDILHALQRL